MCPPVSPRQPPPRLTGVLTLGLLASGCGTDGDAPGDSNGDGDGQHTAVPGAVAGCSAFAPDAVRGRLLAHRHRQQL